MRKCPNCGYCPACGRSDPPRRVYPWERPPVVPWAPNPYPWIKPGEPFWAVLPEHYTWSVGVDARPQVLSTS